MLGYEKARTLKRRLLTLTLHERKKSQKIIKMKHSVLSVTIILVVAAVLYSAAAREMCPSENCLSSEKCEEFVKSVTCPKKGTRCCSIVRSEFRTKCRHHGGGCMNACAQSLVRQVTDCPQNQKCCVLV